MERAAVLDGSPVLTVRTVRTGLVVVVSLFVFLCAWHWRVAGELPLQAGASLALLVALYLVYGQLFTLASARLFRNTVGMPFQFLCGYFIFNSALFVLALCSPFGMRVNVAILGGLGAILAFAWRKRMQPSEARTASGDAWAPWLALLIAGTGATIWCGDIQAPLQAQGDNTIFRVWPDVFIHVREISVFAQAHGLQTIHDIKLAGGPAPLYHFASYLSAAAVSALGGASAMQVYASFQLPFGILLTGLAAYCLVGNLLGRWAGVAAAAAVVLLPDGFHQGFANRYLSYYFMSQVNLGMLYGIACAALAWLFVLDGCRRGKLQTVLLGYVFLGICLFYKAHIFVANSYLLMMFPILFFTPLQRRWRLVMGIAATVLFVAVVAYSQSNPRVPVLRLDGSGIGNYLTMLLHDYEPGVLKTFFTRVFLEESHGKPLQLVYALAMLSLSTFGLWTLLLPAAVAGARKRVALPLLCFPLLVVANYLVMAIGLAEDTRGVGTPDELLNRPLVWAHFVAAALGAGLLYRIWAGRMLPDASLRGRLAAAALLGAALCYAQYSAPGLQTFPGHQDMGEFSLSNAVPTCLVNAAAFIRAHGQPGDIVQDSVGDPRFVLTALSERQLYVGAVGFGGTLREQLARRDDILRFMRLREADQLQQFTAARGIVWFLAYPQPVLAWPSAIFEKPAYACGEYRLYRFPDAVRTASNP
jgi:hypothetical protein